MAALENPPPVEPEIVTEHVAGNRAIFATSDGRLIALHLADGSPAWQLRLGNAPFTKIQFNDFFAVAQIRHDAQSELLVVELFNGPNASFAVSFPAKARRRSILRCPMLINWS